MCAWQSACFEAFTNPANITHDRGSVKANIGHLEGVSGIVGVIKTLLVLEHRMIPPIANFTKPNPRIDAEELCLKVGL